MANLLKRTPTRARIAEFLSSSDRPVDVSEILNFLRKNNFSTNKTTIYRTMDTLFKRGLIDRVEFGEGKFRYELKKEEHHHLICENCGNISDVTLCEIDKLEKEIRKKQKFLVKRHALEFFGVCQNCQN